MLSGRSYKSVFSMSAYVAKLAGFPDRNVLEPFSCLFFRANVYIMIVVGGSTLFISLRSTKEM